MATKQKYRTIVTEKSTNPIVKIMSVTRLCFELDLPKERILTLLANDQIMIDNYGQVISRVTRNVGRYQTVRKIIRVKTK
jgi:hypothetical protein